MWHGWKKTQSFGIGFVLVNSEKGVVFAGARNGQVDSSTEAELLALEEALRRCRSCELFPQLVYSDCIALVELIREDDRRINWRFNTTIKTIRGYLKECYSVRLEIIPRQLNLVADKLTKFALRNPGVSLFHKGLPLPNWLEEVAVAVAYDLHF